MKKYLESIKIIFLGSILALGISYVGAWTGPTATPPNNNTPAPINVGGSEQTKGGRFHIKDSGQGASTIFSALVTGLNKGLKVNSNQGVVSVDGFVSFGPTNLMGGATSSTLGGVSIGSTSFGKADLFVSNLADTSRTVPVGVCVDGAGKLVVCEQVSGNQSFQTPGNHIFTLPAGVTKFTVEVWGAGAGGGRGGRAGHLIGPTFGFGGGGGGSGAYVRKTFSAPSGSQFNLFVGQRGLGVSGGTGGNGSGTNGQQSSFTGPNNHILTAGGGVGGIGGGHSDSATAGPGSGGSGGIASGGDINIDGSRGEDGETIPENCPKADWLPQIWAKGGSPGGKGGNASASFVVIFGGSGGGTTCNYPSDGQVGVNGGYPGAGGGAGGGAKSTNETPKLGGTGGHGANGQIVVSW